ncbi:MAG: energy transducer TonB [Pseudomonadota bacterium]
MDRLTRPIVFLFWLATLVACASGNRPLQLVAAADPQYPQSARDMGIEGFVVVQYDVTLDGRVVNARVVDSEPDLVFDAAALAAVKRWKFLAPKVQGQSVATTARRSTVTFKLGDTSRYDIYGPPGD